MSRHPFRRFIREELGQDLVEYALLLGFLALGAIAGLGSLGAGVSAKYTNIATALAGAGSGVPTSGAGSPPAPGSAGGSTGSTGGGAANAGNNGNGGTGNNGNGKGNGGKKL
jgi:Flp pilus assembly pilin Flp